MFKKIYYLNHSGFIVEGENTVLVFDFYTDVAQILSRFENCGKRVSFFVSHGHQDHWNPDIFTFRNSVPSHYFLDKSLEEEVKELTSLSNLKTQVHFVQEDTVLINEDLSGTGIDTVICTASTDEGVAFWLTAEGQSFFHAGDLNDWDWSDADGPQVEQTYRSILLNLQEKIARAGLPSPHVAFVPVDRRLQDKALQGACIFCEYFQPTYLVPMHLNGGSDLPARLRNISPTSRHEQLEKIEILDLTEPGCMQRI